MRKQYHLRQSRQWLHAWDVDRLIDLTADLPREEIPLSAFHEIDPDDWFSHGYRPTVRAVVEHVRLVNDADLPQPVILDPDGRVMDGMHRIRQSTPGGTLHHHGETSDDYAAAGLLRRTARRLALRVGDAVSVLQTAPAASTFRP